MFIIQKITAVRPPPGRSHGRGGRESLTAPSGCTHTQYGGHREHLEGETQPGWEGAGSVRQGVRRPGLPRKTCIGSDRSRGRQRQAGTRVSSPRRMRPQTPHSCTRRPGKRAGIRQEAPASGPSAGKERSRFVHITLQCAGSELAAPAGNAAQPAAPCSRELPHAPPSGAVHSAPAPARAPCPPSPRARRPPVPLGSPAPPSPPPPFPSSTSSRPTFRSRNPSCSE